MTYICPTITNPIIGVQCINTMSVVYGVPMLSTGFVVILWLIIFFRNKSIEGSRNSIATASFFTAFIGIILGILGLFPDAELGVLIVMFIVSIVPLVNRSP